MQSTIHNTFVIERTYPVSPERVFAAFADPVRKRRWFVAGGGNEVGHYELDFRVGGREVARFSGNAGPMKGVIFTNEGTILDIVPNRRIVAAHTMAMRENHFSASLVTFELLATETGTDLTFTHQAAFFEGADGPEMRQEGWRKLLERLGAELES